MRFLVFDFGVYASTHGVTSLGKNLASCSFAKAVAVATVDHEKARRRVRLARSGCDTCFCGQRVSWVLVVASETGPRPLARSLGGSESREGVSNDSDRASADDNDRRQKPTISLVHLYVCATLRVCVSHTGLFLSAGGLSLLRVQGLWFQVR
eukprot:1063866-Rhodomonas_salina.2